jgi:hypothetical protein
VEMVSILFTVYDLQFGFRECGNLGLV